MTTMGGSKYSARAVQEYNAALNARLGAPLPHSRFTQTAPSEEKWRRDAGSIERVLPRVEATWNRLQSMGRAWVY